jgi:ABC-2 type transport system ATP-binding protein
VERVCDRVAIVRAGRLVLTGDVAALRAQHRRRVELRFDGPAPDLAGVEGVSDLRIQDGFMACALTGDPRAFLAAVGSRATDLTIEPARLEDAFLELYAGEEADEAGLAGARHAAASDEGAGGASPGPAAGSADRGDGGR